MRQQSSDSPHEPRVSQAVAELEQRLIRIESKLEQLLSDREEANQAYYSTADVARILGRADWTVREWCRLQRIHAEKRACGRGTSKEWMISQDELQRIKAEGLLPTTPYRHRLV